jgi:hypothetical protein
MITLTREEAQQVLDVLKDINKLSVGVNAIFLPAEIDEVMETLRTELTKPEPEPVAWTVGGLITDFSRDFSAYKTKTYTQPLYTTPPQRKPEPEPVAWMLTELDGTPLIDCGDLVVKPRPVLVGDKMDCIPLYTAPPQREWVGLTDDKYEAMAEQYVTNCYFDTLKYAKAIEAKLREKNG